MKKIIISLFALMTVVGMYADDTTYPKTEEINVIRIYSSERTGDAAAYPVAEYQNSDKEKYSAELLDGVITIKRTTGSGDAAVTEEVETWENTSSVKYRTELQKIKVTVDGSDSEGREYVILWKNGTPWAKTNVGASKETDYGNYYAWGETTAFNTAPNAYPQNTSLDWAATDQNSVYNTYVANSEAKYSYYWNIYKWSSTTTSGNPTIFKYKDENYKTLETADDAATVNWNTNWCMPSKAQIADLVDATKTNSYQISLNGVAGFRYVKIGDESRYVFLPFAGSVAQSEGVQMNGAYGYYRTNELRTDNAQMAWNLYIDWYDTSMVYDDDTYDENYRCLGLSVRPIYLQTPLTISPVETITIPNATVSVNNSITLTPTVAPTTATISNVVWSSRDESIATVNALGEVTGVKAGDVVITATAADGSGVKGTCTVTVEYVNATKISLSDITITKGATQVLKATFTPSNASDKTVTWSSNNTDVATIDASTGKVTGVSVGEATITATNGNISATCKVYVYIPVNSIILEAASQTIKVGGTTNITATISPDNATNKNVVWTSENEDVATVDENGVVTGVSAGSAAIRCAAAENTTCYSRLIIKVEE